MQVDDRVYGKVEFTDPLFLEILNSKPVQRLKGISHTGTSKFILPNQELTRYEHSIGVASLLKILNADRLEIVAGLLHDTPHTAFSHVVDYVFTNKHQNYHEQKYEQVLRNSEIPEILKKFGFSVEDILDESRFPLLEQPTPGLCADRIDYASRAMAIDPRFKYNPRQFVRYFEIENKKIIMTDKEMANKFANYFMMADEGNFSDLKSIAAYNILSSALKRALDTGKLTEEELLKDDDYVMNKLKASEDPSILEKLRFLHPGFEVNEVFNAPLDKYDFCSHGKLRYVDPAFRQEDGSITTVSKAFPDFAERLENHRKHAESDHYIRITSRPKY